MESEGWLQIPADVRHALDLNDGDTVTMEIVDGVMCVKAVRGVEDQE
jgi:antitoxin component of MazEF toxin-antitoxin module